MLRLSHHRNVTFVDLGDRSSRRTCGTELRGADVFRSFVKLSRVKLLCSSNEAGRAITLGDRDMMRFHDETHLHGQCLNNQMLNRCS